MVPKKRMRTTPGVGTLSQPPQQVSRILTNVQNQGSPPNLLGLTNPEYVARYNALSSTPAIATRYFDDDLLTRFGT